MYKTLAILMLLLAPALFAAEGPPKPGTTEPSKTGTAEPPKPKFTQEQLDKLKASEEQYKDNPAVMNLIKQIKQQSGITDEAPPAEPVKAEAPPAEKPVQGSVSEAEAAYEKGDYETAITQYKALAAAGDPDASLWLGTMYDMGLGTDKDPATAHAWYKKAGEVGGNLLKLEERTMTEEELAKADQRYEEINKGVAGEAGPEDSSQQPETVPQTKDETTPDLSKPNLSIAMPADKPKYGQYVYQQQPRVVKFTPDKVDHMQHLRPEGHVSHLRPEKFNRRSDSKTAIDG